MNLEPILLPEIIEFLEKEPKRIWDTTCFHTWVTAELARSRGLDVHLSDYSTVELSDRTKIKIDERYDVISRFEYGATPFEVSNVSGQVLADFLKTLLTKEEIDE